MDTQLSTSNPYFHLNAKNNMKVNFKAKTIISNSGNFGDTLYRK